MKHCDTTKQKCVIFGAGERGREMYRKFSLEFSVIAYADNNKELWDKPVNGVPVIPPDELKPLIAKSGAKLFICNELYWGDIARQLDEMGLSYYNCENCLCYEVADGVWYPVSFGKPEPCRKTNSDDFAVLFVQDKPCTRTNKIASVLKDRDVKTYSAYTKSPSDAGTSSYIEEYAFWTYNELLEFVNESEFDVIHCSNEPDVFINLLLYSNKKVIHDSHDINDLRYNNVHAANNFLEYLANTQADGVMYTTDAMRDIMIRKYGTDIRKTLVLGNFPLRSFKDVVKYSKLSEIDGEIHCVYEGGVSNGSERPHRYFEPTFLRLAAEGIHVHIYSNQAQEYCRGLEKKSPYIHYEGNYSGSELISEMTRYDIGLAMFNLAGGWGAYLDITSANKLTEYLSSGLPVVSNVPPYVSMLKKNNCGGELDVDGDITGQLLKYKKITIPDDILQTHGFTMDANADRILEFYKRIIRS